MKAFVHQFDESLASVTGEMKVYSPKHTETRQAYIHGEADELGRLAFIPASEIFWIDPNTERVYDASKIETTLDRVFELMESTI
ncbi:MAG: hypothetical protein AAGA29_09740 [Planctomycetota bacterium]